MHQLACENAALDAFVEAVLQPLQASQTRGFRGPAAQAAVAAHGAAFVRGSTGAVLDATAQDIVAFCERLDSVHEKLIEDLHVTVTRCAALPSGNDADDSWRITFAEHPLG